MSYQKELDFAKALAHQVGEVMLKYFSLNTTAEWKEDRTPLTIADTEINRLVIESVQSTYPGDSIHGEKESILTDSNRLWVCDPVDGTLPYSHGLPISTFSLALVVDGKPTIGVIYDPFTDRLFYAQEGSGAFCNDSPIHVSDKPLSDSVVSTDTFPAKNKPGVLNLSVGEPQESIQNTGAKTIQLWSSIICFALVASGKLSVALFNFDHIHDAAAAKIIIEEAGGRTSDLFGNDQRYDQPTKGFIASNGIVHDEILDILKKHQISHHI